MISKERRNELVILICKIALVLLDTAVFAYIWYRFFDKSLYVPFYARGNYVVIAFFAVVYYWAANLYGGFLLTQSMPTELIYSNGIAAILSGIIMYFIIWLLVRHLPQVMPFVWGMLAWIVIAAAWAWPAHMLVPPAAPPCRTLIVYDNRQAYGKAKTITQEVGWRFNVVGRVRATEPDEVIIKKISDTKAEGVMLCGVHSSRRNEILKYCLAQYMKVFIRPSIGDLLFSTAQPMQVANLPLYVCQQSQASVGYLAVKRLFDILLGLVGLVIASPFMLATAIAIKIDDGGPILYKQKRLTKYRREFYVYKFRSMQVDAEKDGVARLAAEHDDRITRVGRVIRAARIDELPQIFNIIAGDMSIVGPRPERPEIAAEYEKVIPEFALRLQAKAGLTGYAQVYGKYNTSPYDKLQMDLLYIGKQGLLTDLKIILMTIKIIFMKDSTEGVEAGQLTAEQLKDGSDDE